MTESQKESLIALVDQIVTEAVAAAQVQPQPGEPPVEVPPPSPTEEEIQARIDAQVKLKTDELKGAVQGIIEAEGEDLKAKLASVLA